MANINVVVGSHIGDGYKVKFRTPCDSTTIEGLEVKYPAKNGIGTLIKKFVFKDAHGTELSGVGNLFVRGVMIEVLLDVTHSVAYIQNADTNSYVESFKSEIQRLEESQKEFLTVAGKAVERCDSIANSADGFEQVMNDATERADSVKGVYVGSGTPPEDYYVQIDPKGETLVMDDTLDASSKNPVENQAIVVAMNDLKKELSNAVDSVQNELNGAVASVQKELNGAVASVQEELSGLVDKVDGMVVDTQLDGTSKNPVENQVVTRRTVLLEGEVRAVQQWQGNVADYVTEFHKAHENGYTLNYRKWNSGIVEGWYSDAVTIYFEKNGGVNSWSYDFYIGLQNAEIPFYDNTSMLYLTASVNDGNSIVCTPKIINHPQNGERCIYIRFSTTNQHDIFYDETHLIAGISMIVNIQMKNTLYS